MSDDSRPKLMFLPGADPDHPWAVVEANGTVTGRYATEAEVCPNDHGNADHWVEDTWGVEHRLECDCDCAACQEY